MGCAFGGGRCLIASWLSRKNGNPNILAFIKKVLPSRHTGVKRHDGKKISVDYHVPAEYKRRFFQSRSTPYVKCFIHPVILVPIFHPWSKRFFNMVVPIGLGVISRHGIYGSPSDRSADKFFCFRYKFRVLSSSSISTIASGYGG